ncbi:MAG: PIG-L family deacetylase [Candidatus Bathyarchaeota archaeon]|nr:PIG-L family deacetylase [Candidatus Bathyarchaeota archaeon]
MGRILAVVSHPDDETFGCGGTLALHEGSRVLCLTCNPRNRKGELENACKALELAEPIVFMEDNVVPSREMVKRVADVIVAEKPRIVVTHLPFDYHADHRATYEVVKEAIEWAAHTTTYEKPCLVERLLLMEINTLIPIPHVLVDISETIEKKKAAVEAYKTQLAKFPWDYYQRFSDKKAELRGTQANCAYAEAFIEESLAKNGPFYEAKATKNLLR